MKGTRGPWDQLVQDRAIRVLTTHRERIKPRAPLRFSVASEKAGRAYHVTADADGWACNCEYWADRKTPCKHILQVVVWLDPNRPPLEEPPRPPRRAKYAKQDSRRYARAQELEHQVFDRLLWDLISAIPERVTTHGKRGRPHIPLRTEILVSVRKVHLGQSLHRARGLLTALNQVVRTPIGSLPNYSVPSRFFNRDSTTDVLIQLIEASGSVLRELEIDEPTAIDSSGFSTSVMGAYLTEAHHLDRKHEFVKAHVAVGTKSHIVLAVTLTDQTGGDSPQFLPLLERIRATGHPGGDVVSDKAYSSRLNLQRASELGFDPWVPFRRGTSARAKHCPMWNKKYHEFLARRDEFDRHYHQRSNVEASFSAIKRVLGENLLHRTKQARFNELLAKLLAYNLWVVIKLATLFDIPIDTLGQTGARQLRRRREAN